MSNKPINNIFLPVTVAFNKPCNRLGIRVAPRSDSTILRVDFYECRGVYWFNFDYLGQSMNSCAFVGLRNCVSCFKDTVKGLRFALSDSDLHRLRDFVKDWEKGLNAKKGVS